MIFSHSHCILELGYIAIMEAFAACEEVAKLTVTIRSVNIFTDNLTVSG